ncbi:glycosyltransferase family 1 protein [Polyangium sp. y55x31]|uniref:glycosyltransferase family 1 protein n=1 Tax=Polyangium sp. y55x31 TaxID=3042688 RepID=UPI002482C707|nr:glycosyltransferase family 1 protein [Polyangium sp. y55x31]MDI1475911.1 glycosyltransferase family 1 protein [Polyangium sp. y55x31]
MMIRGATARVAPGNRDERNPDVVCLSHLRWNFVFQRPQHILTRCARRRRVFFFEEPMLEQGPPRLALQSVHEGVMVAVPHLPPDIPEHERDALLRHLVGELIDGHAIADYVLWYYTPMAVSFTRHLEPIAVVYDCMDELSAFAHAPPALREREVELLRRADVVFTGGHSLYEAKRDLHPNIHPIPSSVDVSHFGTARSAAREGEPIDQAAIPRPRLGFFGVIDERMDLDLIAAVADARRDWHIVMLGPVVKIDPATLPRRPNVHWLGMKKYEELPAYLAGWDVALLPFARNQSTRFISPTKTPEYLAAGKPVVSTSIRDVVRPYGEMGLVRIADAPGDFVTAIEAYLGEAAEARAERMSRTDDLLARTSWDRTYDRVEELLRRACVAGESALCSRGARHV